MWRFFRVWERPLRTHAGRQRALKAREAAEAISDGINWLALPTNDDVVVSRFVYGTKGNVPDYMVRGADTYRLVTDHLGSVRLVVKVSDGSVAQRIDYDEFGVVANDTSPGLQPFGFAGGLYDADTKLVRFGARDYDAGVGRWTAKDPIRWKARQANLYVYVADNPVNLVDVSGKTACTKAVGATGIGFCAIICPMAVTTGVGGAICAVVCGGIFWGVGEDCPDRCPDGSDPFEHGNTCPPPKPQMCVEPENIINSYSGYCPPGHICTEPVDIIDSDN